MCLCAIVWILVVLYMYMCLMLWDNHSKDSKMLNLVGGLGQVGHIFSRGLGKPISSSLTFRYEVNSLPLSCAPNMIYMANWTRTETSKAVSQVNLLSFEVDLLLIFVTVLER